MKIEKSKIEKQKEGMDWANRERLELASTVSALHNVRRRGYTNTGCALFVSINCHSLKRQTNHSVQARAFPRSEHSLTRIHTLSGGRAGQRRTPPQTPDIDDESIKNESDTRTNSIQFNSVSIQFNSVQFSSPSKMVPE